MGQILHIETATRTCSASLAQDGEELASRELTREHFSHAEELTLFLQEVMDKSNSSFQELDAVAVGTGPGSYTGLRIGVSTAKALSYGLDIPLISVRTLRMMARAVAVREELSEKDRIVPMFDARRNEVYCSLHDGEGSLIEGEKALELEASSFPGIDEAERLLFIGSGAGKAQELLRDLGAEFRPDEHPSASDMVWIAHAHFLEGSFEDPFSFEPFYLKDFVPTTPKADRG